MTDKWGRLSPAQRRLVIVAAAVEAALKVAMLYDLKHRPDAEIRGSKKAWAASALINSAGVGPLLYFVVGRRATPPIPADTDHEPLPG